MTRRSHRRVQNPRTWADQQYVRQAAWLRRDGELDDNDYSPTIERNAKLLTAAGRDELLRASGSELRTRNGRLPKFCAPWSSSALVANLFDYWRGRDLGPLTRALGAAAHTALALEHKLHTGFGGAANVDVLLSGAARPTAIEAKFLEPFGSTARGTRKEKIQPAYLDPARVAGWHRLDHLRALAVAIVRRDVEFRRLDAPQLIKHAIALARRGDGSELVFLWYAPPPSREAREMEDEIARFAIAAHTDGVPFRTLTYQVLFDRLRVEAAEHGPYLEYLGDRYF